MAHFCPSREGWGPLSHERPIDFTTCFQHGVITPCLNIVFILAIGIRLCNLQNKQPLLPVRYADHMFWFKLTTSLIVLFASISELVAVVNLYSYFCVYAISILLQLVAVAAAIFYQFKRRPFASKASTSLLLYWLGFALLSLMRLRTSTAPRYADKHSTPVISNSLSILAALVTLVLESQSVQDNSYELPDDNAEEENTHSALNCKGRCYAHPLPEEHANIFSLLTFTWMTPLLTKGNHTPLELDDTWRMSQKYHPSIASIKFQQNWQIELDSGNPSLFRATVLSYGMTWAIGILYTLVRELLMFFNPILLSRLIGFVSKYNTADAEPIENGYFYAFSMLIVTTIQSLSYHHAVLQFERLDCQIRMGYMTAIYRKTMKLSNNSREEYGNGAILTHMNVDSENVVGFITHISHQIWSFPLRIIITLYLLHRTLGWSSWVGVLVTIVSIPTSTSVTQSITLLMKQLMSHRDHRITLMDEVLSGIKAIKLYAWEVPFIKRINKVRVAMELNIIRKISIVRSMLAFVTSISPFVASFATFGLYTLMDNVSHGPLTPQLAFVSLTLFNMLKEPLSFAPRILPELLKARVSNHRILRFMTSEEIDNAAVEHLPYNRNSLEAASEDVLVSVQNGFFEWPSNDEPILRDINIQCRRDELVAIIGRVGSGKTSLASAILGDLNKSYGKVKICGSVAYVAQESWILNATFRDNILFGSKFDQEFYNQVIDACALRQDMDVLPAGDMTEIGERGINLSGGQKMRVSLARAVYARADVYILDDPLAAVDAHVSKHIFAHVLGPQGLLRSMARILVTNAVQYLNDVDNIIMLQDGKVIEQGSFAQVMSNQKDIAEFIQIRADVDDNLGDSSNTEDAVMAGQHSEVLNNVRLDQRLDEQSNTNSTASNGHAVSPLCNQQMGRGNSADATDANARITTAELKQQGKVDWSTYRVYFQACGLHNVGLLLIAMLLAAVSNILANIWLERWSSLNEQSGHTAKPNASTEKPVMYYLVIYGIFGLVGASSSSLKSLILWTKCSISASTIIHDNLLKSVLHLPMSFFDATPLGRIINRFSTDMKACDETLPDSFYGFTEEIIKLISAIIIIGFTTPLALMIVVILILIYCQLQQLYLSSSRELRRIESITRSPIFAHFQESIQGISTIRAYIMQSSFIAENENRIAQNIRAYYTSAAIDQWLSVRLNALGNLLVFVIALVTIVLLHLYGIGSAGLIGLAITYAFDFTSSLHWLTRHGTNIENGMTHIERMNEYSYITSEAGNVIDDHRPKEAWPEQGEVEFKNYSTRYREGLDLALEDLTFCVQPRQKVGIVGRTGAGKSSLTMALFRIIEAASGQILLDGEDIAQYGLFDVRSKISIIPQDPVLFAGTVRENLDPFGSYSDQDIWRALEQAHLADYIRTKDERLDFMVAHAGKNFSGGQKQLICLARALLKRTNVLVLDEATAAIDKATDEIIQQTIRTEFKYCTVLTIAHRLNTIINSDMVLVIDGGRLAEYDTPKNLLARKDSIFASLVEETKTTGAS